MAKNDKVLSKQDEMQECVIDLGGLRSPYVIYQDVVPRLQHIYLLDPSAFCDRRIVWDFQGLEPRQINVMALCLFLSVAETVRKRVQNKPEALFAWKPEVNHFLENCDFFSAVRDFDLCTVPNDFIGSGANVIPLPRLANKLFWFSPLRQESEELPCYEKLRAERLAQGEMLYQSLRSQRLVLEETVSRNISQKVIECVVELCVNAKVYSCGMAFGMIQVTGKYVSISLVDNGIGLHKGLLKMKDSDDPSFTGGPLWHNWNDFSKLPQLHRDLASILEATCTRPTAGEPGIWDVLQFVLEKPGARARIHTSTATVEFDQELLAVLEGVRQETLDTGAKNKLQSVEAALLASSRRGSRGRFCQVSSRGTHFDLMFPLERSTSYVGRG